MSISTCPQPSGRLLALWLFAKHQQAWMPTQVYQPLENGQGQYLAAVENAPTGGGQQAMEVNRIEDRGKGWKGKHKGKGKERKDLAKRLELSVLCKQAKDSDLEEVEEKAKEEEKDEEKEKERKVVKARRAKVKAKAKERKEKENALEEQYAVFAIKKDIGETNAPIDIQYGTLK